MKRKSKKVRPQATPVSFTNHSDNEFVHLRLCHFCHNLNESSTEVVKCEKCARYLSPGIPGHHPNRDSAGDELDSLENALDDLVDEDESSEEDGLEPSAVRRRPRINGLAVEW